MLGNASFSFNCLYESSKISSVMILALRCRKYRESCKNDQKAAALVGLSLSDERFDHVQGVHSAKEMRQCILDIFEQHNFLRNPPRLFLKEKDSNIYQSNSSARINAEVRGSEIDDK